jgi:membrane-associated phospholipid phosphatase
MPTSNAAPVPIGAFLGWPGWPHLRRFVGLWALVCAEFVIVFVGADFITANHSWRLALYADAELAIPLVPEMVIPYSSVYLVFALVPFVLRKRSELDAVAAALARVIAFAGLGFLLLPAELAYAPAAQELAESGTVGAQRWAMWLDFADRVNLDYNLIPSLHVALFLACAGVFYARARGSVRALLAAWSVAIAASTVLTHQHHLVDVVAGVALGAWGVNYALRRQSGLLRSFRVGV